MEKETITLSKSELRRLRLLNQVLAGERTVVEVAQVLQLSVRQVHRLLKRYREQGAAALAHGNRGRTPTIAYPPEIKERVLELAASPQYAGCNDTHLAELLADREGIHLSRPTLRRWLREAGRPSARKRRPPKHRRYRERAPRFGLLIQIDTSFHPWFEDRGPKAALVAGIDDATGQVVSAHFREQEDTDGYFTLLADILRSHGIPGALYHDGRSTFVLIRHHDPRLEAQLEGLLPQTQFARACDELGIALIHARSPQAKGRIERLWATLQDRLVIELRLAGVSTVDEANAFLPGFLEAFNQRFSQPPAEAESGFIPLPPNLDVDAVCCRHHYRKVMSDNTVSVNGVRLQLPPGPGGRSYRGLRVQVQQRLDGTWAIYHEDTRLCHPAQLAMPRVAKAPEHGEQQQRKPRNSSKPSADHPWRRRIAGDIARHRAQQSQGHFQ